MPRPADANARLDLLRAAEAVFVERGVDRAKVEEITARAGRSKGSFYLHFASKEEAFRQIVLATMAQLVDKLEAPERAVASARHITDARAYFDHWHARNVEIFEFVWQNRSVFRLFLDGGQSATFNYMVDAFAAHACAATAKRLEDGVKRGIYRDDFDVALASQFLSGAYDRVARDLVRRDVKPDLSAWLRALERMVLFGLASRETQEIVDRPVKNRRRTESRVRGIEAVGPLAREVPHDRRARRRSRPSRGG